MRTLHVYLCIVVAFGCLIMLWSGLMSELCHHKVSMRQKAATLSLENAAARGVEVIRPPAGSKYRGVGMLTPAGGESLAVTAVARWAWEKYPGRMWRGLQLPVMTAWPAGRLGNLMSEYATLYALGKVYGVTVRLHPRMYTLRRIFPHLSIPLLQGNFSWEEWEAVGGMSLTNYAHAEAAAAGLLGPDRFVLYGTPHESQLFHAFRRDLLRELTFSDSITTKAQAFLSSIVKVGNVTASTTTFVGFHIRRGDYTDWLLVVGGRLPSERYYRQAMNHFRRDYHHIIFVVASSDRRHINHTFAGHPDVVLAPGISAEEDLAILAACNHSIMTVGTFGFWGSYLAGGEVVYPNTTYTSRYKMGPKWFRHSKLDFFTPVNDD